MNLEFLLHPFMLGLGLGLFCAFLALWRVMTLKLELRRFRQHLSERVELEATAVGKVRNELETLRKENEQMRIKIGALNVQPALHNERNLEIFARAEKRMLMSAPGFAPAWENAKSAAEAELQEEEAGRNLPKRVFTRLFGSSSPSSPPTLPPSPPGTPEKGS